MDISNKYKDFNTILNIEKIERVLQLQKKRKQLTNENKKILQTIDIFYDRSIYWNEIKKHKNL